VTYDYSDHEEKVAPDQLALLGDLVIQLKTAVDELNDQETRLKAQQDKVKHLREKAIPELMQSIGLKDIKTLAGLRVKLREEVRASLPKDGDRRKEAFEWLRTHGHEGLVKHEILKFNKEQRALADKIFQVIEKATKGTPLNFNRKDDIHHQTLCAFLREQLREGKMSNDELPLFGAFIQTFAEVGE
jgi:hypothetical protein